MIPEATCSHLGRYQHFSACFKMTRIFSLKRLKQTRREFCPGILTSTGIKQTFCSVVAPSVGASSACDLILMWYPACVCKLTEPRILIEHHIISGEIYKCKVRSISDAKHDNTMTF
jgi:hypothetical protein